MTNVPPGKKLAALALLVPIAGVVELVAHIRQTTDVVSDADWTHAKDRVKALAKPEDLVSFAPRWIEPVGREKLGEVISLERAAPADESRFPRAVEIARHGARRPALREWKESSVEKVGNLEVRVLENPRYRPILADLVSRLGSRDALVSIANDGDATSCGFVSGATQTGGLGFGTAIPGQRFSCPNGAFAGVSIVTDLDYYPHRCIYAPPPSGGALEIHFPNTKLGDVVSGHHALYVEAERHRQGAPVSLSVRFGNEAIGKVTHVDGEGWKGFEFPTGPMKDKTGDLVFSVSAAQTDKRAYCFEAVIQ